MFPDNLEIEGRQFNFVKQGRRGDVAIYVSKNLYARVGEREVISRMHSLHKKFEDFGFPVPTLISFGNIDEKHYFVETSLGEKCFGILFREDFEKHGKISDSLFEQFISVTEKFAYAQIRSAMKDSLGDSFTKLIGPNDLADELPEFRERILKHYHKSFDRLKGVPLVLTHGDFNPHNLFPSGVIDFEEIYYGPLGYDIVSNIFHISYFPKEKGCERHQLYYFSKEQEILYYSRLDHLYEKAGLPRLSENRSDLELCRAIWATARNSELPKLQQWRYKVFTEKYLKS